MKPHAIVTILKNSVTPASNPFTHLKVECSQCQYTVYTGGPPRSDTQWENVLDDHLSQHEPGRALDIDVGWEPVAECPVCDDGMGMIVQEDDGLTCKQCGTWWSIDGTNGMRKTTDEQ